MNGRDDTYMRDSDAFSWYMERDPLLRSTIVSVVVLDRAPDFERLLARADRATRLAPGFRHKVVEAPMRLANPRWVVDPDFDLTFHVRRVAVPPPGALSQVFDYARQSGMAGFDRERALWEFTVMEGLSGGRAALVLKVHHALTDGIGGMEIAKFFFDLEEDAPDGDVPEAPVAELISTIELARDAIAHNANRVVGVASDWARAAPGALFMGIRHPRTTVRGVSALAQSIYRIARPVATTLSPVMADRRLEWHYDALAIPFPALRDAAHAAGLTLNDAFLGAVTGGLDRYHEARDAVVDELRLTMPISIRRPGDPIGGNRITLIRFKVPVGLRDVLGRMKQIHQAVDHARNEPGIPYTNAIAGALNLLPRTVVGGMLKHVDFLASNVPGIPIPLYLLGTRVLEWYAFGPTIGSALNATLISYNGTCFVGITIDTGAVDDPDAMIESLRAGFVEVLGLAEADVEVRRPPAA